MDNDESDKPIDYAAADKQGQCGSLHIQPEKWERKLGAAFCPCCNKLMGRVGK